MPVQTRRQLATDPEMCMFALTVSIVEPKNIKEAMVILHGSKQMQDDLHRFDRTIEEGIDFEELFAPVCSLELFGFSVAPRQHTSLFQSTVRTSSENENVYLLRKLFWLKQAPRSWYDELFKLPDDQSFTKAFSDADHAGCLDTQKSTSGGIQFLGDKLVSWMSKKQNALICSSAATEAEYVWSYLHVCSSNVDGTQLQVYGFNYNEIPLKRAGQEVLEEPVERQKIGEASGSGEEQSTEKEKELLVEELQKLLVIVPVEESR
ncbi:gag-pol polyprotein [Tanacetum coccineum]